MVELHPICVICNEKIDVNLPYKSEGIRFCNQSYQWWAHQKCYNKYSREKLVEKIHKVIIANNLYDLKIVRNRA